MSWIHLILGCIFCVSQSISIEPISTTVGVGIIAFSASKFMLCTVHECCNDKTERIAAKIWIKYDFADKLKEDFKKKLHGQHLAQSIVAKALDRHINDQNPRKALVFSFHGWTGSGKNFVSFLIARAIYHEGLKSNFVNVITATEKYPDPSKAQQYKNELIEFVSKKLNECGRQLFIFDEVDKVPDGVIDGLAPFLEYSMDSKERQKAIYIFLSNTGGQEIALTTYNFYMNGMKREEMRLEDIESLIDLRAFNDEGGLQKSSLINRNLIDFFIPFLPLEKKHVKLCIIDYLAEKYNRTAKETDKLVIDIANQLEYFPRESNVYSKSGCKKVARKVDQMVD